MLNIWRLNIRKNQVLCVPLNGPHPSIVLFHVWFVLNILTASCRCLLCVLFDSPLISYLAHFLCSAWFLPDIQPFPIICQCPDLSFLCCTHRPSFLCSLVLFGCLNLRTCIPNLLHSPGSASVLLSGSFVWFALAIYLVLSHFVLKKVIFLESHTLHSMEWLLLSNLEIQQPQITVTE